MSRDQIETTELPGSAPPLSVVHSERLRRQREAEWRRLLSTPPPASTPGALAAPAPKAEASRGTSAGAVDPSGAAREAAGAVVTGAAVAGQALLAGGKSAVTDPLGFLRAIGEGALEGGKGAAGLVGSGASKLLGGLWSQFSAGPNRAGAADLVEGLFEVASSPFIGLGMWAQSAYEALEPEEKERIVLPGGRGSAASSIRRVFHLPVAVAEAIRTGRLNPTPEEEAALDAPMTAGELLNIIAAVSGPKAVAVARRTVARRGVRAEPVEAVKAEPARDVKAEPAEAAKTEPVAEKPVAELPVRQTPAEPQGPRGAEPAREPVAEQPATEPARQAPAAAEPTPTTEAQARQFVERAGGKFIGFTEVLGEPYVWFNDLTYGTTMLLKAEEATVSKIKETIAQKTEEFRAARQQTAEQVLKDLGVETKAAADLAERVAEQPPPKPPVDGPYQPNYNYIKADAETKQLMRQVYTSITERIAQRRGEGTFRAIDAEAERLIASGEVTVEKMLETPPAPDPVPAPTLRAYRMLEVGAAEYARGVRDRTLRGEAAPGELRRAIALAQEVSERTSLAKTGTARALAALRDPVEGVPERVTPEALARFADSIDPRLSDRELAQALLVAERVAGQQGMSRLMRAIRNFPDAFMELFYGSILWGKAIGRNFLGNLAMEPLPDAVRAIAPYMPRGLWFVTPKDARLRPGVVPGEAVARLQGHLEGWMNNLMAKARLEGIEDIGGGKLPELSPALTARNLGLEGLGPLSAAVDYLGSSLRMSSRLLAKNDVWTKAHMVNAELYAIAHRRATLEGLSGEAFLARFREFIEDPAKLPKADRAEISRRVRQDTLTFDIEFPVFRALAEAMDRIPASSAAFRFFVFAFPRITSNMFETFASYTPVLNMLSTRFWTEIRAGGDRAQMAYARLALGSAIYAAILAWADSGILTGDLPNDPVLRAQALKRTDYQERSINLFGRWVSYRGLGVLEDVLATAANFRQAIVQIPSPDLAKVALALGLSMYDAVDNMAFINTFGQFASILEQVNAPEKRVENIEKFMAQKLAALIPLSGALKEVRRTLDPVQRELKTLLQRVYDTIPGLSTLRDRDGNLINPPRRDMLTGEPLTVLNLPFIPGQSKDAKHDPVWEEVWRLGGAGLRPVPEFVMPGLDDDRALGLTPNILKKTGVQLTPQEIDRWIELQTTVIKQRGMTMHEQMAHLITTERYQRQSDATKAAMLQNIFTGYREAAKGVLIRESPLLQREMNRARAEDAIKRLPPERQEAAREALRPRIQIAP